MAAALHMLLPHWGGGQAGDSMAAASGRGALWAHCEAAPGGEQPVFL